MGSVCLNQKAPVEVLNQGGCEDTHIEKVKQVLLLGPCLLCFRHFFIQMSQNFLLQREALLKKIIQLALQSEVRMKDIDQFVKDSDTCLYVRCPRDPQNQQHQWIQFCTNCSGDHDPKFIKKAPIYIQLPRQFEVKAIEVEGFATGVSDLVNKLQQEIFSQLIPRNLIAIGTGSFSELFPLSTKPNDDSFMQLQLANQKKVVENVAAKLKENQADTLYETQVKNFSTMKCICAKSGSTKLFNWVGKCENCNETSNHQLVAINNQKAQIELKISFKIKVVNFRQIREFINQEFKMQQT